MNVSMSRDLNHLRKSCSLARWFNNTAENIVNMYCARRKIVKMKVNATNNRLNVILAEFIC